MIDEQQMMQEVNEILGPATDIANAAFKLLIERSHDLEMSPMVAMMFLRELCEMNAHALIDDKQKAINKFVMHVPGLAEHIERDKIDVYKVLQETVAKVVKGGMREIKVEEM